MGNPQGTGGPIEEATKDAVRHVDDGPNHESPVDRYAKQAVEQAGMLPAGRVLLQAQQRFIKAQTTFIHDHDRVTMRTAQVELIIELLDYVGAQNTELALTMGERYIADLHQLIEQHGFV